MEEGWEEEGKGETERDVNDNIIEWSDRKEKEKEE